MSDKIRVVVADDHPLVRLGLLSILGQGEDIDVVGEAVDCDSCLRLLRSVWPDLLLLDLELPDASGVDAVARVRSACPRLPMLVLSAYDDDWRVRESIRLGARGYLTKGTAASTIIEAVRTVANGGSFLAPAVAVAAIRHRTRGGGAGGLSDRERAVLRLLRDGMTNRQIARLLQISEHTVKHHLSSTFRKLGATNRTDAVRIAGEMGQLEGGNSAQK